MCKYVVIFEEAVSHKLLCNRSRPIFLIYEKNLIFFFISVDLHSSILSVLNLAKSSSAYRDNGLDTIQKPGSKACKTFIKGIDQ
jgi:hypothetical protein